MASSHPLLAAVHARVSTPDQDVEKFAPSPSTTVDPLPHTTRCHELATVPLTTTPGAHVENAETSHEALQRAVMAMQTLRHGDAS